MSDITMSLEERVFEAHIDSCAPGEVVKVNLLPGESRGTYEVRCQYGVHTFDFEIGDRGIVTVRPEWDIDEDHQSALGRSNPAS